ncbi:MAG: outer membrane beta-barrel protein [bacterium]
MNRVVIVALALTALAATDAHARKSGPSWDAGRISAGPHFTHLTLSEEGARGELEMGGMGGAMRFRASRRWAVEVAFDILAAGQEANGQPGEVSRITMPFTGSGMFYFRPESSFQPYLLAGLGVAAHSIRYDALGERLDFSTPIVQLGLGFEYRFDVVRLDVSLRSLGMYQEEDDIDRSQMAEGTYDKQPVSYRPNDNSRDLHGALLNIGIFWGF